MRSRSGVVEPSTLTGERLCGEDLATVLEGLLEQVHAVVVVRSGRLVGQESPGHRIVRLHELHHQLSAERRQEVDDLFERHEAELWWFHSRGELAIAGMDGTLAGARWRLKGRGHVLTIRSGEDGHEHFEAYDIKELRDDLLVLNVDVGMEVRGIARLEFERTDCVGALREGRIKELRATGGAS